jgi:hypothetical protein
MGDLEVGQAKRDTDDRDAQDQPTEEPSDEAGNATSKDQPQQIANECHVKPPSTQIMVPYLLVNPQLMHQNTSPKTYAFLWILSERPCGSMGFDKSIFGQQYFQP